jgi:hypothetical protein
MVVDSLVHLSIHRQDIHFDHHPFETLHLIEDTYHAGSQRLYVTTLVLSAVALAMR